MQHFEIPPWLYTLLKIGLLIGFTIPFFLWGTQLVEMGRNAEQAVVSDVEHVFKKPLAESSPKSAVNNGEKPTGPLFGVDASHYQGVVQWEKVAKEGYMFAFAKATGGITYVDPEFEKNWHGIRAVEMYRGAYHFFYAADDPKKQAAHYLRTVGELSKHDFPPVLDVEISDHTKPEKLLSGVLTWLEEVEKASGRRPIIYTDNGFADKVLTDSRLSRYPLWIADYATEIHSLPKPWQKSGWSLWQYSEKGRVDGVTGDIDINRFSGSLAELTAFISQSYH